MDDFEITNRAHSLLEELLAFGVSVDTIERALRGVVKACARPEDLIPPDCMVVNRETFLEDAEAAIPGSAARLTELLERNAPALVPGATG